MVWTTRMGARYIRAYTNSADAREARTAAPTATTVVNVGVSIKSGVVFAAAASPKSDPCVPAELETLGVGLGVKASVEACSVTVATGLLAGLDAASLESAGGGVNMGVLTGVPVTAAVTAAVPELDSVTWAVSTMVVLGECEGDWDAVVVTVGVPGATVARVQTNWPKVASKVRMSPAEQASHASPMYPAWHKHTPVVTAHAP